MHYWEETSLPTVQPPTLPRPPLAPKPLNLRPFELKTSIYPGMTTPTQNNAWSLVRNEAENGWADPDRNADCGLLVYDPCGKFRSLGHDDVASGQPGARGLCDSNGFVVQIVEISRRCKGTLASVLHSSTSTVTVNGVTTCDDGQPPKLASGNLAGVKNDRGCAGAAGDACWIYPSGNDWQIEFVVHKAQSVETNESVSGTSFQHKTRTIAGMFDGDESSASTWHAGTTCPT
jgi:hypothetical protein